MSTPRAEHTIAVVLAANGRIRPDLVLVNGEPERYPEGAYCFGWREKTRRIRLSVGNDAQDAAARRDRKEAEINAINGGVSVSPENGNGNRSVVGAVAGFSEERYDLLKFSSFLRDEKKQSPRSVYNKFETVMIFLKANGIRGLVGKSDCSRYTTMCRTMTRSAPSRSSWNRRRRVKLF